MKQRVNHSTGEREAVRTTIVGGRPPGSGRDNGNIPRGMEVLIKKAAVDPEFRAVLVEKRAGAADTIGLELTASESAILKAIPDRQLLSIISHTGVPDRERRIFLGRAAAAMLAVLGAGVASSCAPTTKGIRPEEMPERVPATDGIRPDIPNAEPAVSTGVRPDVPPAPNTPVTKGIRPDVPRNVPAPTGIRPDVPDDKKPKADPPPPAKENIQYSRGVRPDIPKKVDE